MLAGNEQRGVQSIVEWRDHLRVKFAATDIPKKSKQYVHVVRLDSQPEGDDRGQIQALEAAVEQPISQVRRQRIPTSCCMEGPVPAGTKNLARLANIQSLG